MLWRGETQEETMKRIVTMLAAMAIGIVGLAVSGASAQQATPGPAAAPAVEANPVTNIVRSLLERQAKNTIAAAEEMPADKYDYKPTPAQITFGHLIVHIINANNGLCSKYGGITLPTTEKPSDADPKEKLLPALKASFDVCTQALAKADDSNLGEPIKVFGDRPVSRAAALIILTNEFSDHYGMQAMYLRLNGLVPPTAQK
jgi:hypothetical protein